MAGRPQGERHGKKGSHPHAGGCPAPGAGHHPRRRRQAARHRGHGIKLNYHGSITIDTDILEAARLLPLEYVYIWNKHSGSRIETYVLPGPRGSGVVCLNGAAARTCQVGDEIIVASSREIPVSDYHDGFSCRVLTFDQSGELPNRVAEKLEYRVAARDDGTEFVIMDMATGREWIG